MNNFKVANFFKISLLIMLFSSCSDKIEKNMNGMWSIDTIYYRNKDIKACLLTNIIEFNEDNCDLPHNESYCEGLEVAERKGGWKVIKGKRYPLVLKINSQNKVFFGEHHLVFKKDERNKLLKMVVKSDSLYVVARKGLYEYDMNLKTIDDLINLSHSN